MTPWASAEIFPEGGNVDVSLILFQVTNDAMQRTFTKRFLRHKENSPLRHTLRSYFLKSYWGGVVLEFAKRLYFLSYFTAFAELGYHPISLLLSTRQLIVNWIWTINNYVCGAHISLCGLNLTSQNLVWNVFYTLAIRKAFSFQK